MALTNDHGSWVDSTARGDDSTRVGGAPYLPQRVLVLRRKRLPVDRTAKEWRTAGADSVALAILGNATMLTLPIMRYICRALSGGPAHLAIIQLRPKVITVVAKIWGIAGRGNQR